MTDYIHCSKSHAASALWLAVSGCGWVLGVVLRKRERSSKGLTGATSRDMLRGDLSTKTTFSYIGDTNLTLGGGREKDSSSSNGGCLIDVGR